MAAGSFSHRDIDERVVIHMLGNAVLVVLLATRRRGWTPAEMHAALAARGIRRSPRLIADVMSAMVRYGLAECRSNGRVVARPIEPWRAAG